MTKILNNEAGNSGYVNTSLQQIFFNSYTISLLDFYADDSSGLITAYTYVTNTNTYINWLRTSSEYGTTYAGQDFSGLSSSNSMYFEFASSPDSSYAFKKWLSIYQDHTEELGSNYNIVISNLNSDITLLPLLERTTVSTSHNVNFMIPIHKVEIWPDLSFKVVDHVSANNYISVNPPVGPSVNYYAYGQSTFIGNYGGSQYTSYTIENDHYVTLTNISYNTDGLPYEYVLKVKRNDDSTMTPIAENEQYTTQILSSTNQVSFQFDVIENTPQYYTASVLLTNPESSSLSFAVNSTQYDLNSNTVTTINNITSGSNLVFTNISYSYQYLLRYKVLDEGGTILIDASNYQMTNNGGSFDVLSIPNVTEDIDVRFTFRLLWKDIGISYLNHGSGATDVNDVSFKIDYGVIHGVGASSYCGTHSALEDLVLSDISYAFNSHEDYVLSYKAGGMSTWQQYVPSMPITIFNLFNFDNIQFKLDNPDIVPSDEITIIINKANNTNYDFRLKYSFDNNNIFNEASISSEVVGISINVPTGITSVILSSINCENNIAERVSSYRINNGQSILYDSDIINIDTIELNPLSEYVNNNNQIEISLEIVSGSEYEYKTLTIDYGSYPNSIATITVATTQNNNNTITRPQTINSSATFTVRYGLFATLSVDSVASGYDFDKFTINGEDHTLENGRYNFQILANTTVTFTVSSILPTTPYFEYDIQIHGVLISDVEAGFGGNGNFSNILIEEINDNQLTMTYTHAEDKDFEYVSHFEDEEKTTFEKNVFYNVTFAEFTSNTVARTIALSKGNGSNTSTITPISNTQYKVKFRGTDSNLYIRLIEEFSPKTTLDYNIDNAYTNLWVSDDDTFVKSQIVGTHNNGTPISCNLSPLYSKGYVLKSLYMWQSETDNFYTTIENPNSYTYDGQNNTYEQMTLNVIPDSNSQRYIAYLEFDANQTIPDFYSDEELPSHKIQHNYVFDVHYKASQIKLYWNPDIIVD